MVCDTICHDFIIMLCIYFQSSLYYSNHILSFSLPPSLSLPFSPSPFLHFSLPSSTSLSLSSSHTHAHIHTLFCHLLLFNIDKIYCIMFSMHIDQLDYYYYYYYYYCCCCCCYCAFVVYCFSLGQAVQLILCFGILFSYALQMYVPIDILWPQIEKRWGPFKWAILVETVFRSFLVVITCKYVKEALFQPFITILETFLSI